MNKYTFRDNQGKTWKRVSKRAAQKAYDAGQKVHLCPSKLSPFGPWNIGITVSNETGHTFNDITEEFRWYNCSRTTGQYVMFYLS